VLLVLRQFLRRFNDLSIRSKLVMVVAGVVTVLTVLMLVSVAVSARRQINHDVLRELEAARRAFVASEGEHLHEHVVEVEAIAESDFMVNLLTTRHRQNACRWAGEVLSGKKNPIHPEDAFDLIAVVLPDGVPLAAVTAHHPSCSETGKWRFPRLSNHDQASEVTNWESPNNHFFELVQSPIVDADGHDWGTLIVGFEVSTAFAQHIRQHTGQDSFLWHMDGGKPHLLGASNPALSGLLETAAQKSGSGPPFFRSDDDYSILNANIEDKDDIVSNPLDMHLALVQPLEEKFAPFRRLEYNLLVLATLALVVGLALGVIVARPIARPLARLATVAEFVTQDKLEAAGTLLQQNPKRMAAKDEIGVLGRSFVRMVQELKERLAMSAFLSQATFDHIQRDTADNSASSRTSLAILFSDVRKFSNFAETRDPVAVIEMLNQVLGIEAEIIKKHAGDIDKFVGDAVVAWFSGPDRCQRAIQAANEITATLQERFQRQPGTMVGIGIHAGAVVVGSIGSAARKDYTAIGATVNLAARLCSAAQPGQVLVSQAVVDETGPEARLKPLTPVMLKGFSEPVPVFDASFSEAAGT
jgi:class 3 adenylate cyclase